MGINKEDATSFEEMANEMDAKTAPEATEEVAETTEVADEVTEETTTDEANAPEGDNNPA